MTEAELRYRQAIQIGLEKIREECRNIIAWCDAIEKHLAHTANMPLTPKGGNGESL